MTFGEWTTSPYDVKLNFLGKMFRGEAKFTDGFGFMDMFNDIIK